MTAILAHLSWLTLGGNWEGVIVACATPSDRREERKVKSGRADISKQADAEVAVAKVTLQRSLRTCFIACLYFDLYH